MTTTSGGSASGTTRSSKGPAAPTRSGWGPTRPARRLRRRSLTQPSGRSSGTRTRAGTTSDLSGLRPRTDGGAAPLRVRPLRRLLRSALLCCPAARGCALLGGGLARCGLPRAGRCALLGRSLAGGRLLGGALGCGLLRGRLLGGLLGRLPRGGLLGRGLLGRLLGRRLLRRLLRRPSACRLA